jgi:beta-N-acetylhexosaminidase
MSIRSCRRVLAVLAASAILAAGCGGPAAQPAPTPTAAGAASSVGPAPQSEPPTSPACTTRTALARWSLTRLAEQTVVVPVDENHVSTISAQIAAGAGGVILFGSQAPAELGSTLRRLAGQAPDGIAPMVMTDEEGGVVQRMANLVGDMPSARQMAATMSTAQIQALASQVGRKMKAAGVTVDLAPVLDLDARPGPSATNPDGTRSFSATERVAEADGLAFARGLLDAGVVPVVKHFPGLGGASGNTDDRAATTLPWSTLRNAGLLPFRAAVRAGMPAVMIANAAVPGLTSTPASLSTTVITSVLRGQLHFDGLVLTDSLSAKAISAAGYSVPAASLQALRAGADMVLFDASSLARPVVQAIVGGVGSGRLSRARLEDAVAHILAAKHVDLCR